MHTLVHPRFPGNFGPNKTDSTLRVYDETDWERTSAVEVKSTAISTNPTEGSMYFDTRDDELKVYAHPI